MRRILTALVLIPSVVFVIFLGPPWLFQLVAALMAVACFHEYAFIANAQKMRVPVWFGHALGLAVLFLPVVDWRAVFVASVVLMLWSLTLDSPVDALPAVSATLLGIIYVYGAWKCASGLREASPWWLLFAVSINWVGDSAAMYGGKFFGKRKLAPVVSPKKTWEGSAASALLTTVFGALLLPRTVNLDVTQAALLALVAGIAGQIGDLVESAMKRGADVKDSGNMLPGHGGWLDRLDSTLFSMPVVAFYLQWLH
ncbi:MAG: phosphatidate cytidylyltransferase [Acidobacteria bacterium]|nr:phosphatidate cytidylyltransferase [Acidobacteriota bacterium]